VVEQGRRKADETISDEAMRGISRNDGALPMEL